MMTRVKIIIAMSMVLAQGFSYAQNVSESEAAVVAVKFMSDMKPHWTKDSVLSVHTLIRNENISVYEVVGCDGSSVLLSGRKECVPILGYIPSKSKPFPGALVDHIEKLPDAFIDLLGNYSEQVDYCSRHALSNSNTERWDYFLAENVSDILRSFIAIDPLVSTKWGQASSNDSCPGAYNHHCPHPEICPSCPAGCVAVAMAQIMRYWTFPTNIPWRCNQFDWSNMPNQIIGHDNTYYIQQREATSRLISDCGTSVHTNYCPSGCESSVPYDSMCNVIIALRDTFGYSESMQLKYKSSETDWESILINELQQSRPLLYFGAGTGGHAFVCDGCIADPSQQLYWFHFNWGWTGTADGYFVLSALTPDNGQQVHNYSYLQGAIFGITPGVCFQNIIMECDNIFAHTAIRTFSAVDNFSNNSHIYKINSGAKIYLHAGNEIILTDGFLADVGSRFHATIAPCSSAATFLPDYSVNDDNHNDNPADALPVLKSLQAETSFANDRTLTIYPNPTADILYIELSGANITNVALYDLQGRTVGANNDSPLQGIATLNVRNVPAGVYVLRVTDTNGKEYHQKVVVD
jgi:hypothetical protein